MSDQYDRMDDLINEQMKRADLTPEDILQLTIARRLNRCSDHTFSTALGGSEGKPPLNFWNRR